MKPRKAQRQGNERRGFVRLLRLLCFLICLGWMFPGCASQRPDSGELAVRWVTDPADARKSVVEVSGLNATSLEQLTGDAAQSRRLLAVYAGESNANLPPMAGSYEVQSGKLFFKPQFPLEPGVSYRAVFQPEQKPSITAIFQLPANNALPATVVSRVYPSADLLPENLLKFYVYFSAPMSRGRIYDHIHLREASGKEVELPFLQIDEELWDATMTRLTLFIDPGRIKRGVLPLEEVGAALEIGKSYALVIDRQWRDSTGNPLKESFQKTFNVGSPDREPIDPKRWQMQPPPAGTQASLSVNFTEALDHALVQRLITVALESGEAVEGKIALLEQEHRWEFTPANSWRRGRYHLVIQTTLEDLAGNNIGKPFDVDLLAGVQRRIAAETVKLPFEVH